MKNKYPIALKLIIAFYLLVVIVGIGQIWWGFRFEDTFESPTETGFYMGYRLILSIIAITLFFIKKRLSLYWVMAIESATNIFVNLTSIYIFAWYLIEYKSMEATRYMFEEAGIITGWNALLMLISCAILGYIIATFKNIIPNKNTHSITASGGSE